jgi:hypothetical protein
MNKVYNYVIVGTGPTGLSLAWYLAKENKTVLLIDKETSIGGCHRVQRVNGLFTEHGPRVYSDVYLNFIELLEEMNLKFNDMFTLYSFNLATIGNKNPNSFKLNEMIAFILAFIMLVFNPIYGQDVSMKTFMDENSFTLESKDYVDRLCRLTDGAQADRYTLFQFLQLINNQQLYGLYQPVKPNDDGLLHLWENKLKETKLVSFLMNHDVISLNNYGNTIDNITVMNRTTSEKIIIKGERYILAIPPKPLKKLLLNSEPAKYAFGDIDTIIKWSNDNSYFEYIPITLHWKNKIDLPKIWGFPASDWGLAFIVLSNYMKFNRPIELENSNTVISTAITFTDRKSNFTNKTADESDINEINTEVLRQLRLSYPDIPNPDFMLISPQVYKDNDKWVNMDTAFVSTPDLNQYVSSQSLIFNNLYNCGAHNGKSNYHFTAMETAVVNALHLFNKLEPNRKNKRTIIKYKQITEYVHIGIIILIIMIGLFIYRDKIIKYFSKV